MIVEDQSEVQQFLKNDYSASRTIPEEIETHISNVYIYKNTVLKLKKAVRLPYLDFSTAETRLEYCKRELALNRRTAPDMYRAVHTIVRRPDGRIAMDEDGTLIDAVVEMARFEQDQLLDSLAQRGPIDSTILDELANSIADFHLSLAALDSKSGAQALKNVQQSNENGFLDTKLSDDASVTALLAMTRIRISRSVEVLDKRSTAGYLRRCHGDLHLRNICLVDGNPILFDCLEFDEELANIDVLYDLAFLLMDLWHREHAGNANQLFNRYLDKTGDIEDLRVMPLFLSLRAAIRAHVLAAQAESTTEPATNASEARSYIDLAHTVLKPASPKLVVISGRSGSGKSTIAAAVAPHIESAPGARILSTDRIRKALFNTDPLEPLPPEAYSQSVSDRVYEKQRQDALRALHGGWTVICDGVFLKSDERSAIEDIARQAGVPFTGIWLEAPKDKLLQRVQARRNDPSDATGAIVDLQSKQSVDAGSWTIVDATQPITDSARAVQNAMEPQQPA